MIMRSIFNGKSGLRDSAVHQKDAGVFCAFHHKYHVSICHKFRFSKNAKKAGHRARQVQQYAAGAGPVTIFQLT